MTQDAVALLERLFHKRERAEKHLSNADPDWAARAKRALMEYNEQIHVVLNGGE